MQDIIHEMERQYHCRYELGGRGSGVTAFPVTHVLEAGRVSGYDGRQVRFAYIHIVNGELLNWCTYDETGYRMAHGSERNIGGTRAGYRAMIRRALRRLQTYGARRVYPRDRMHRHNPARTTAQWTRQGWPQ